MSEQLDTKGSSGPPAATVQDYIDQRLPTLIGSETGKRFKSEETYRTLLAAIAEDFEEPLEAIENPAKHGLTLKRVRLIAAILGLQDKDYEEFIALANRESNNQLLTQSHINTHQLSYADALYYVNCVLSELNGIVPTKEYAHASWLEQVGEGKRFDHYDTLVAVLAKVSAHYHEETAPLLMLDQGLNKRQASTIAAVRGITPAEADAYIETLQHDYGVVLPFESERGRPAFSYSEAKKLADDALSAFKNISGAIPIATGLGRTIETPSNPHDQVAESQALTATKSLHTEAQTIKPTSVETAAFAKWQQGRAHKLLGYEPGHEWQHRKPKLHVPGWEGHSTVKNIRDYIVYALNSSTLIGEGKRFKNREMLFRVLSETAQGFNIPVPSIRIDDPSWDPDFTIEQGKLIARVFGLIPERENGFLLLVKIASKQHHDGVVMHEANKDMYNFDHIRESVKQRIIGLTYGKKAEDHTPDISR